MSAKKLDQSVFDGLPSEYRWAAVDAVGDAYAFKYQSPVLKSRIWLALSQVTLIGLGYDASDWRNSLIERLSDTCIDDMGIANAQKQIESQDVPTSDIDWSRQEVPAGATHYDERGGFYRKDRIGWLRFDGCIWIAVRLADQDIGLYHEIPKPAPQVDWSKAPEGATHYAQSKTMLYKFHKKIGDKWAFWAAKDGWVVYSSGEHERVEFELANAIKRPESINDIARSIEAARIEEQACMPFPDGDARYFETSAPQESGATDVFSGLYEKVAENSDPYAALPKTNALADAVASCHAAISKSAKETILRLRGTGMLTACIEDERAERSYQHYFKDVSGVDAIDLYHVARLYDITDPALFHAFKKIACAGKRGAKNKAQDVQEAIDALKRWQELSK